MNKKTASTFKWPQKKLLTLGKISRGELPLSFVLRNKLQKIKRIARLNTLEDVDISKLLIGQQCGTPLKEWVEKTKEYKRVSTLLTDSPYVKFLREVDKDNLLLKDKARLKKTAYFAMSLVALKSTGNFMGNSEENAITDWMIEFYKFYTFDKKGMDYTSKEFLNDGHSGKNDPVQVFRLKDSEYYEIIDGHHRCAIAHMCKMKKITVEISGSNYSYLQRLIINSSEKNRPIMLQPVNAPEIKHWPKPTGCKEKSELMLHFLERKNLLRNINTCLDIPCKYGYFLNIFKDKGLNVYGIDTNYNSLQIAKTTNNITDNECSNESVTSFLQNSTKKFDIVSYSTDSLSNNTPAEIVRNLERITNKVLFFDYSTTNQKTDTSGELTMKLINENTDFIEAFSLGRGLVACLK